MSHFGQLPVDTIPLITIHSLELLQGWFMGLSVEPVIVIFEEGEFLTIRLLDDPRPLFIDNRLIALVL